MSTDIGASLADVESDYSMADLIATSIASKTPNLPTTSWSRMQRRKVEAINGLHHVDRLADENVRIDGLPSSGSLVDESRLVFDQLTPSQSAQAPPLPTGMDPLSLDERKKAQQSYELIESSPLSGIKK